MTRQELREKHAQDIANNIIEIAKLGRDDLMDYLEHHALDYEFVINAYLAYKDVIFWITLGGPNISINTRLCSVCIYELGLDPVSALLPTDVVEMIDSIGEELYENTKCMEVK